jgi:uncharacterized protein
MNVSDFPRKISAELALRLTEAPAVALLGPRQVGKTTLAQTLGETRAALYLDLESPADRAMLTNPELFFADHRGRLVILDEVHQMPGLFAVLRGAIDRARKAGHRTGQFLLLGSASIDLLKQSGESLAGRVSFIELNSFQIDEICAAGKDSPADIDRLWLRGGFPESFLAKSNASSLRWRQDFIRTYLQRDIPQFGPRIAAETLRRFWTMLAHGQSTLLNIAQLARNLGVDAKTAASYVDLLVDCLLVRRLQPWHGNSAKRLVKSPKIYVRDSGLVHALLSLESKEQLLAHPVVGGSWEGFVIENLVGNLPEGSSAGFYRSGAGAEIDLVITWPNGEHWAVEIKRSTTPKLERGFHHACEDVMPSKKFIVTPGDVRYRYSEDITVISTRELMREITAATP